MRRPACHELPRLRPRGPGPGGARADDDQDGLLRSSAADDPAAQRHRDEIRRDVGDRPPHQRVDDRAHRPRAPGATADRWARRLGCVPADHRAVHRADRRAVDSRWAPGPGLRPEQRRDLPGERVARVAEVQGGLSPRRRQRELSGAAREDPLLGPRPARLDDVPGLRRGERRHQRQRPARRG